MKISLSSIRRPVLIVKDEQSPCIYTSQVAGCACMQVEVRGYVLPLEYERLEWNNYIFNQQLWYGQIHPSAVGDSCSINELGPHTKANISPYTREDIYTMIDEGMEKIMDYMDIKHFHVDRTQLNYEAWVHVKFHYSKNNGYDYKEFEGILTWENCD